jgi:hypothetical protein
MKCSVVINTLTSDRHLRSSLVIPSKTFSVLNDRDQCCSTELVNGLTKAAVETSSHREAVCSPVLASHKTEEQPPLVNGYRRKLSESESIVTSSPAHPRSSRKRLAPVPMQSKGEMGAQSLAEAAENDSSYESSYSVMSDSDLSNDVNGLSGVNNGSVPQHLQSVGQGNYYSL